MGGFPILNLQLVKKWAPEFLKNWFSILEVPVVKFKWVNIKVGVDKFRHEKLNIKRRPGGFFPN